MRTDLSGGFALDETKHHHLGVGGVEIAEASSRCGAICQNVNVIRHDGPGEQLVIATVVKQQHVFRVGHDARVPQIAFTQSAILVSLQLQPLLS